MKPKPPLSSRARIRPRRKQQLSELTQPEVNQRRPRASAVRKDQVVSIAGPKQADSQRPQTLARDARTQRVIVGIGGQRLAFDFTTRVTELIPGTGPAPVVPFKTEPKTGRKRKPD